MKRAIGIIRVSEIGDRDVDRLQTTKIQREIIERDCERLGLELTRIVEELDVSGGKPIAKRGQLLRALREIESDRADAIVFAYRDRMDRSIEHGGELVRRMDAKGALLIAGGKQITHATHDGWRTATLESFLNEDQRRAIQAKMRDVHQRATEDRGVACFRLPPGYRRRKDGVAEPDGMAAEFIKIAWEMRGRGESISTIRRMLAQHAIYLTDSKVQRMLRNRFYLGELHRGPYVNLHAHEPLVTQEVWDAAQSAYVPRGRLGRSQRLLARQSIAYCACGGRMVVGRSDKHYVYRCGAESCDARARISAPLLERHVLEHVQGLISGLVGRANGETRVVEAKAALDAAQGELDYTLRLLEASGLGDEPQAMITLTAKRGARDLAQVDYTEALIKSKALTVVVTGEAVLRDGTLTEQQALIKAVIRRITVAKGRGLERVTIESNVE